MTSAAGPGNHLPEVAALFVPPSDARRGVRRFYPMRFVPLLRG